MPSLIQLILSAAGILLLWGLALLLLLFGVVDFLNGSGNSNPSTTTILFASALFLAGLLLLPSAWYAWRRLKGQPVLFEGLVRRLEGLFANYWLWVILLPIASLLAIVAGSLLNQTASISWLLPPFYLLAVGLPVLWLVYIGRGGLSVGGPQKAWAIFGLGLIVAPSILLVLELTVALLGLVGLGVYASTQPALLSEIMRLSSDLRSGNINQQDLLQGLAPYLFSPIIIYSISAYIAGIVPLLEELFKPIGVWLLLGDKLTPAQGFAAGILSGAGYALFENLTNAANSSAFTISVTARLGTALLHVLTPGLFGWALAMAWSRGRYWLLGLVYLLVVSIHGLWNGMVVVTAFSSLAAINGQLSNTYLAILSGGSVIVLGLLGLFMFLLLVGANLLLRRTVPAAPPQADMLEPRTWPLPGDPLGSQELQTLEKVNEEPSFTVLVQQEAPGPLVTTEPQDKALLPTQPPGDKNDEVSSDPS